MNNLFLYKKINSLPTTIKTILWQFVRGDTHIRDFELWVYSNENDMLSKTFGKDSYLELALLDYKDEKEINNFKIIIYDFLIQFPESCLCYTFPNNTSLYPFTDDENERTFLQKQIELLKATKLIKAFSGKPLIIS